jgi:hypothetical protein
VCKYIVLLAWSRIRIYLDQIVLSPLAVYATFRSLTSKATGDVQIGFAGDKSRNSHMR